MGIGVTPVYPSMMAMEQQEDIPSAHPMQMGMTTMPAKGIPAAISPGS